MSEYGEFTGRNESVESARGENGPQELDEFLASVRERLEHFNVQIMVPDDDASPDAPVAESLSAGSARRCFRLFPSGRVVCFP
jgi:hypothetical protein